MHHACILFLDVLLANFVGKVFIGLYVHGVGLEALGHLVFFLLGEGFGEG